MMNFERKKRVLQRTRLHLYRGISRAAAASYISCPEFYFLQVKYSLNRRIYVPALKEKNITYIC